MAERRRTCNRPWVLRALVTAVLSQASVATAFFTAEDAEDAEVRRGGVQPAVPDARNRQRRTSASAGTAGCAPPLCGPLRPSVSSAV